MAKYPQCDGKVYKRARFGDISIKGTAKEHEIKMQRQRFARREAAAARSVAGIEGRSIRKIAVAGSCCWRCTGLHPQTVVFLKPGLREERSWAVFNFLRCG